MCFSWVLQVKEQVFSPDEKGFNQIFGRIRKGTCSCICQYSDCCIEESLNMARYAKECGVTYLVSALPFYLGLTQKEIIDYYTTIADNVPLPLFLYNIPAQTKLMISVEAVKNWLNIRTSSA